MEKDYSFGHWMKQHRQALDLTQEELAHKVGCTGSTVRHIEAGRRRPSRQLAMLIVRDLMGEPVDQDVALKLVRDARLRRTGAEQSMARQGSI